MCLIRTIAFTNTRIYTKKKQTKNSTVSEIPGLFIDVVVYWQKLQIIPNPLISLSGLNVQIQFRDFGI